ncbi:hypothetical protein BJX70DRAFT_410402 [Aspergillus crustosus]
MENSLKQDLPMSMAIAAFAGISWCLGIEINLSLFFIFRRRRGIYFASCALCSCGVILQPLFIILANYDIWSDGVPSITMIELTWLIMVIPQSWVLYSRLHLLTCSSSLLKTVKYILVFNSVSFSVPTIVMGIMSQTIHPSLVPTNMIWDRVQLVVFFLQETSLSVLYILQTRKYLHGRLPLRDRICSASTSPATTATTTTTPIPKPKHPITTPILGEYIGFNPIPNLIPIPTPIPIPIPSPGLRRTQTEIDEHQTMLRQLIYGNILIIALDIALLGIQCGNMFYLQGAFKPCVYAIKLKVEFAILNRLREVVLRRDARNGGGGSGAS